MGDGKLHLCNVYSAPGRINLPALPTVTSLSMIYIGDFNAWHPSVGDLSLVLNCSGLPLLQYMCCYCLTYCLTIGGATHIRRGMINNIIMAGLVGLHVKCVCIQTLLRPRCSWPSVLSTYWTLPSSLLPLHHHTSRILPQLHLLQLQSSAYL